MGHTDATAARVSWSGHASPLVSPAVRRLAPPVILVLLTFFSVALYDPFHRSIGQDPAIFAYLSRLVALGSAPPQLAFNEQAALAFLLGGGAMWLGSFLNLPLLVSYRLASALVLVVVVVLTYGVGKFLARSGYVGFLAGLILIGFQGYILRVAITLEPKSLMLVFGLGTLCFLYKRQWFWAGVTGCAAGLAWQIAWGYLVVALLLAAMQGGILARERARAIGLAVLGAACAFGLYFLYFLAHHAQLEMLQQTFIAPVLMHDVVDTPFTARALKLAHMFYRGFGIHIVFGVLSVLGLGWWLGSGIGARQWRAMVLRFFDLWLQNPRTSGTLLVILGFFTYSMLDFQNYPDWIPLLPFVSIFAAYFMFRVVQWASGHIAGPAPWRMAGLGLVALLVTSFSLYQTIEASRSRLHLTWQEQQKTADDINAQLPADAPIWLLGKTEILFFTGRHNLNKYIYVLGRVDAAADILEPGGFEGMFRAGMDQKPVLYVISRFKPDRFSTRRNYEVVKNSTKGLVRLHACRTIGPGQFYTQPEFADTLFAANSAHCIKRR